MLPDRANNSIANESPSTVHHNWIYRRVALPIFALLRMGASPEKLAWSIAFGLLIGGIIYYTNTRVHDWLLPAIWAATGVMAGLGSRESRAPIM